MRPLTPSTDRPILHTNETLVRFDRSSPELDQKQMPKKVHAQCVAGHVY